ncbi:hypothetical protein Ddye_012694 [Dipteronia dyeriana]|uniref:Protein FAR1-RELATED SEQUENCE n=1 Tax=Dipteronia dyeriana TaxID=168575 RepID=A0AAD9X575_9ROSI|nr:hypothetical protein Ddye_012694 [Dipteronia dyeriana]
MRSTQRSESINSFLNRFLNAKLKLYEFMSQIDRALSRLRNNELKDDFDCNHESPVLMTHLMQLEKHASEVFTRNTFAMVCDKIKSEARLSISNCVHDTTWETYTFKKFGGDDTTWTVTYRCGEQKFECYCKLFDTAGIPCCHYFGVMKSRNMLQITETLILPRWTTNAKDDFTLEVSNNSTPTHIIQIARYFGAIHFYLVTFRVHW